MKLYYTGAVGYQKPQSDPNLSLGGFISSTVIPNDKLGNIFPEVSSQTLKSDDFYTIGIVLKNEMLDIQNLKVWTTKEEEDITLEIAFVKPAKDITSRCYLEKLTSPNESPYIGDFLNINGEVNKVNLGALAKDEYMGIWIRRKYSPNILTEDKLEAMCLIENVNLENTKKIGINFEY